MVKLTDHLDMTIAVYHGQLHNNNKKSEACYVARAVEYSEIEDTNHPVNRLCTGYKQVH